MLMILNCMLAWLSVTDTTVTGMIESLHTCKAHVYIAHEVNEFPSTTQWPAGYSRDATAVASAQGAQRPHVLTTACCMAVKIIHTEIELQAM